MEQIVAELQAQVANLTQLLAIQTPEIHNQIATLNQNVLAIQALQPLPIEEHTDLPVPTLAAANVSRDIFKTLPEFSGNRSTYSTWRSVVKNAIKLLENHVGTTEYYQALIMIRNKISGAASNILTNYNTPFNFDAIIDRLDFTYADKRPLYVLEQEMLVLQQGKLTLDEFYDKVNEKLNAIVNKINMTYSERTTANAFINSTNEKALRTFITGLNNRRGEILYASNPSSLPEAYARLQTITNDQERMHFANQYNRNQPQLTTKNPQFKYRQLPQTNNYQKRTERETVFEPMEVDKLSTRVNVDRHQSGRNHFPNPSNRNNEFGQRNVTNTTPFRREISRQGVTPTTSDQKFEQQRFNNLEDRETYAKSILQDDDNFSDISDNEISPTGDISPSTSSIFLGE